MKSCGLAEMSEEAPARPGPLSVESAGPRSGHVDPAAGLNKSLPLPEPHVLLCIRVRRGIVDGSMTHLVFTSQAQGPSENKPE